MAQCFLKQRNSHCTPQGHSRTYRLYVCKVPVMQPCWPQFGDTEAQRWCIVFARRRWNEQDPNNMKRMLVIP